ncbi:MAG: hypothetical protein M3Y75_13055 [Actinomycetota bacterium]|nr:hypothetical protein [Actinomycetota bacterium]
MSRLVAIFLAALAATLVALGPAPAPASGEGAWQADPLFKFHWQLSPPPGDPFEGAYRIYDSDGEMIRTETRPLLKLLEPIMISPVPGIYTLEAWLQNKAGERGTPSTTVLRFDNAVPPAPTLQLPEGWIRGTDPAVLQIAAAAAPPPLSGIGGYALSVDRGEGSSPCVEVTRCESAEIDLTGGGGGSASLGALHEGIHFVRAVAVSGSGVASPVASTQLRIDATPPAVSLQGAPAGWSNGPVRLSALASDPLSGMATAGPLGPFTAIAVDGAPPARSLGDAVTTWVTGSGTHHVEYFARDAAGNVADGEAGAPEPETAVIRIDEDPPSVTFSAAQDPVEPERIEATVRDALSGPSPGHGWIGVRPAGTTGSFSPLPTQVAGSRLIARWDSDSHPPGKYEFFATGFDAAGNAAVGVNRDRGGRMFLVNPLKTPTVLTAGFVGKRARNVSSRRARHGRGVRFGGSLRTRSGAPVAGVEITVAEALGDGSKFSRRTTFTRTRGDGRFEVWLAPGPSREVTASFAGSRILTRASSPSARLEVPASVRLRASAAVARVGGAPVVFSGRVARAGTEVGAVAGLPVELQFRFHGTDWSGFRTVETDGRGRFRYPYRFSDDDSRGVRFQFRAHVKGREGWPYGPSASRPVLVTGR